MSLFVTFEGPEGCGKTSQMNALASYLASMGYPVYATREPGGTRIGDLVRAILLDRTHAEMQPAAEVLLFSASRAQLVGQEIAPRLEKGSLVLCDRYADSTLAYQGYGLGLDISALRQITAFATAGLVPTLTFLLDLPVEVGLQRKQGDAGGEWNRLDAKALAYHTRVREGYLRLAADEPHRWRVVEARRAFDVVQADIRSEVQRRLGDR